MDQKLNHLSRALTPSATASVAFLDIHSPSAERFLTPDALPDLSKWCFFLDLDGTLLDLAASPYGVRAEAGLQDLLTTLSERSDGALAIVTGRTVEFVDHIFPGHDFAVAGIHGSELRFSPAYHYKEFLAAGIDETTAGRMSAARDFARLSAALLHNVIFEDKGRAFALHYRLAPGHETRVRQIMDLALQLAGDQFILLDGKSVIEMKPANSNKGRIVDELLQHAPFAGKFPLAAGDDQTDEAMFDVVNHHQGLSVKIARNMHHLQTSARFATGSPGMLRSWLRSLIA